MLVTRPPSSKPALKAKQEDRVIPASLPDLVFDS